ncbi:hypothetical protein DL770_003336 [Monosporascus sp. CRB-9-2]|nr:hypothetical protein DL770_003336 [Monosporascus sp. CRB-9-2]
MSSKKKEDKYKPTSPQSPRHQIARSITSIELSSPVRLPKHHNRLRHHHHSRRDRDHDELDPVSASSMAQYPRASLDAARSEGATSPYTVADQNRRMDYLSSGSEDVSTRVGTHIARMSQEQLQEEREKMVSRITGLRESLADLSSFSTATTRRLDDTYYAVLEKLGMLQSTVMAFKELADDSQELNEVFKDEYREVAADIGSQLDGFGQFDDQQQRIESLQERVRASRKKVRALSKRVDVVRERIEGWERADKAWQEKTRRRLKVIWLIMSTLLFNLILLFVGAKYGPASTDASLVMDLTSGKNDGQRQSGEFTDTATKSLGSMTDEVREELSKRRADTLGEDAVLRTFDEL